MANETGAKDGKDGKAALKVLAPGQEVERAATAPDGTVTIAHAKGKLLSVDIADVDLLRLASELVVDAVIDWGELRREIHLRLSRAEGRVRHFSDRRHGVPPV